MLGFERNKSIMYNFDIIAAGEYISIGRRVQSTSRISRSTAELLLYFSQLYSQQYIIHVHKRLYSWRESKLRHIEYNRRVVDSFF